MFSSYISIFMTTYNKEYYQKHRELMIKSTRKWQRKRLNQNPKEAKEKQRKYNKKYCAKKRSIILNHYGGVPPKCACCGENHVEFLSVDHINGGGNKHRKEIGMPSGSAFYG